MGLFHEQAMDNPPPGYTAPLVPTDQAETVVKTIDVVGDSLGAVGVPFASYAGELAAGVLAIATVLVNASRSRHKKANATLVKGIEQATTTGEVKAAVLKRSLVDGTTKDIQKAVVQIT